MYLYLTAQQAIKQAVSQVLTTLQLPAVEYQIEHPELAKFGDLSINLAMRLFPQVKHRPDVNSPLALAQLLAKQLIAVPEVGRVPEASLRPSDA